MAFDDLGDASPLNRFFHEESPAPTGYPNDRALATYVLLLVGYVLAGVLLFVVPLAVFLGHHP